MDALIAVIQPISLAIDHPSSFLLSFPALHIFQDIYIIYPKYGNFKLVLCAILTFAGIDKSQHLNILPNILIAALLSTILQCIFDC